MNQLITIMGTLGIGKTTYASLIAERLGYTLVTERYQENPFLAKFYEDMPRWAFHSQSFFLLEKAKQLEDISTMLESSGVVQDTPIFQDVYTYALAQHKLGNMTEDEWQLYTKQYTHLIPHLPKPSLIVYLSGTIHTIMQRIKARGRSFEQNIPESYIRLLHQLNGQLIETHKNIPTLFVDCDTIDIVHSDADKEKVVSMIEQTVFPLQSNVQPLYSTV